MCRQHTKKTEQQFLNYTLEIFVETEILSSVLQGQNHLSSNEMMFVVQGGLFHPLSHHAAIIVMTNGISKTLPCV